MSYLKQELNDLRYEFHVYEVVNFTAAEEKEFKQLIKDGLNLPDDVRAHADGSHYRTQRANLTENEVNELLLYKQSKYLKTIKNCLVYFVVISVLSMIAFISTLLFFTTR